MGLNKHKFHSEVRQCLIMYIIQFRSWYRARNYETKSSIDDFDWFQCLHCKLRICGDLLRAYIVQQCRATKFSSLWAITSWWQTKPTTKSISSSGSSQSSQKMLRRSGRSYGNAIQTIANDPDRFKIYTIVQIVRIELNSIQAMLVVSVVRSFAIVWVAFPYDRPDRLNIFLRRLGRSGRSYGNQALKCQSQSFFSLKIFAP